MTKPIDNLISVKKLLAELRHQDTACAWTLKQSFKSLAPQTLEEVYELIEAIEQDDTVAIKDELSDLLYHVMFYLQMAEEQGLFQLHDVIQHIHDKHEQRMPDPKQRTQLTAEQANEHWEQSKLKQRAHIFEGIARNLPALTYARKLQERAAQAGFDWHDVTPVLAKLQEEVDELTAATDTQHQQEELGDILFTCINLARHLNIDPDTALRSTNRKFSRRLRAIENLLAETQQTLIDKNLDELDALWNQVKTQE